MTLTKPKAKQPTTSHKKRVGQHHRHGEHYMKAYWPYIPVFAILGLGILLNGWLGRVHHNVLGYATSVNSQVLLEDTNVERSARNESALLLNSQLSAAAQAKATDMANRNYWAHTSPDGREPWSFIANSGYKYQIAGENLAYGFGSSKQIVDAWMQSPEHKANILNAEYQEVGFGSVNVPNYQGEGAQTIVVALYGAPQTASVLTAAKPTVQLSDQTQNVSRLELVSSASWVQLALAALCGAALTLFFVRHTFAWHKALVRGERFVLKHPVLDVVLISATVLALLLGNVVGAIL